MSLSIRNGYCKETFVTGNYESTLNVQELRISYKFLSVDHNEDFPYWGCKYCPHVRDTWFYKATYCCCEGFMRCSEATNLWSDHHAVVFHVERLWKSRGFKGCWATPYLPLLTTVVDLLTTVPLLTIAGVSTSTSPTVRGLLLGHSSTSPRVLSWFVLGLVWQTFRDFRDSDKDSRSLYLKLASQLGFLSNERKA